ncbi:hypothetical protein K7X08_012906 [Anisodus acutangulus]|uniref:Uncharacterized protein n=1 Tax=Anisodus acutangulus TaxID=402998 RepID=A0A9Q1RGD8_9SOLA|nr:hypothetical protein K7X08_012906 [Anisodus acutangulus]
MEELTSALNSHMDQMADLVEKISAEMRSSLRPAYDNFIGFFHAIHWAGAWGGSARLNTWKGKRRTK